MDQIYIPKKRECFDIGDYVTIRALEEGVEGKSEAGAENPFFYNIKYIEPIKIEIAQKIISLIGKYSNNENIIIMGSFLDEGFCFNDLDIIIISEEKCDIEKLTSLVKEKAGIRAHIMALNKKALFGGLSSDPLYEMMLGRFIAKKRFLYRVKRKINYKLLDLHLLKSKILIDNFDYLNGNEKYYLVRNMIAIYLYLRGEKINNNEVDKEIEYIFHCKINEIKGNIIDKMNFLKKYKEAYRKTFDIILKGIKNDTKQK